MTGSNVINVLKGAPVGGGGYAPQEPKLLLVTDNRWSRLDSPFCVITQHRKFEVGHHRQSRVGSRNFERGVHTILGSLITVVPL